MKTPRIIRTVVSTFILALVLCVVSTGYADSLSGRTFSATLKPMSRLQRMPQSVVLIETEDARNPLIVSLTLVVNSTPYVFKVMNIVSDACQSVHIFAHNKDEHGNVMDMELVDNRTRVCQDFIATGGTWMVNLQVPTPDRPTLVKFTGTPTP